MLSKYIYKYTKNLKKKTFFWFQDIFYYKTKENIKKTSNCGSLLSQKVCLPL